MSGSEPPNDLVIGRFVKPMLAKVVPKEKWPKESTIEYKYLETHGLPKLFQNVFLSMLCLTMCIHMYFHFTLGNVMKTFCTFLKKLTKPPILLKKNQNG